MSNFDEKIVSKLTGLKREIDRLKVKERASGGGGVTDHGDLTGLSDDDHPQYAKTSHTHPMAPILSAVYPIGSIYLSTSATNPGSLFGGTWVAWGTGRVAVGVDVNQSEFNTVEKTGGAKQHAHGLTSGYAKIVNSTDGWVGGARKSVSSWTTTHRTTGSTAAASNTVSVATELGGNTDNGSTLPPYITCYMWKRTA